jgi:uncharacterized protein YbjT (DUF2867 family)
MPLLSLTTNQKEFDMILVTGGRGAVATHLQTLLREHDLAVRVASNAPDAQIRLNLTDPATFPAALAGVTSVFLYAEAERIDEFVAEAVAAGVQHIVLLSSSSVLDLDPENPLSKAHLDVEKALLGAPFPATLLRPGSFAGNASGWAWAIRSGRPVSLPYPGSYTDPIHEKDVAEAAFAALTDPRHQGGQFTLTGPEALTFTEQINLLTQVTGQDIDVQQVTRDQWKADMAEYIPGPFAEALLNFWESNDGKPVPLTTTVEELTGHPARTFEVWATDHAADFKH